MNNNNFIGRDRMGNMSMSKQSLADMLVTLLKGEGHEATVEGCSGCDKKDNCEEYKKLAINDNRKREEQKKAVKDTVEKTMASKAFRIRELSEDMPAPDLSKLLGYCSGCGAPITMADKSARINMYLCPNCRTMNSLGDLYITDKVAPGAKENIKPSMKLTSEEIEDYAKLKKLAHKANDEITKLIKDVDLAKSNFWNRLNLSHELEKKDYHLNLNTMTIENGYVD